MSAQLVGFVVGLAFVGLLVLTVFIVRSALRQRPIVIDDCPHVSPGDRLTLCPGQAELSFTHVADDPATADLSDWILHTGELGLCVSVVPHKGRTWLLVLDLGGQLRWYVGSNRIEVIP